MRRENLRATVLAFGLAFVVLGAMLWLVGFDEVVSTLQRASPGLVAVAAALILAWIVAWGLALWVVLGITGVDVPPHRAVLIYAGAAFANNVTPFGQAGGEPLAALIISDATDAEYETGLAAIASVDALNFAPSISLALIGVAYFAATTTLGRQLRLAAILVVAVAVVVPTLVYLGWRYRYELERRAIRWLTPLLRGVGRVVPRISPPEPEVLAERVEGFFAAIERVATDRRGLAQALAFSTAGWLCQAIAMWVAFLAIGHEIPPGVPLVVIPIGTIASAAPLPGGLGGIESVHVVLLSQTTGVAAGPIAAAVLIHRVGGFSLTSLVGGGALAAVRVRER